MFKLTKLAQETISNFIIHHTAESGDFNLTEDYASIEEAIQVEADDAGCSVEEMENCIASYTAEEVIEAAEDGEGWPEKLGLVEFEEEENLENINEPLLKKCVCGVEDNSRINDAQWSDWCDGLDVIDAYGEGDECEDVLFVIDRAVETNGESLKEDLPLIEQQLKGQNFSGSFYDRK